MKNKKELVLKKQITKEKNKDLLEQDTVFTFKIKRLSVHLEFHKKDHSSRRSLMIMVGKRKRLLNYQKH